MYIVIMECKKRGDDSSDWVFADNLMEIFLTSNRDNLITAELYSSIEPLLLDFMIAYIDLKDNFLSRTGIIQAVNLQNYAYSLWENQESYEAYNTTYVTEVTKYKNIRQQIADKFQVDLIEHEINLSTSSMPNLDINNLTEDNLKEIISLEP